MNSQPHRLPAEAPHAFGGAELDRNRPLEFRLDGRTIHGFAGDTVLSAALACGIDTAGTLGGAPIGLDERFAPLVVAASQPDRLDLALPMARLPALHGLDLVTFGTGPARGPLSRLGAFLAPAGRANAPLTGSTSFDSPWLNQRPDAMLKADIAIVGGGVAGLSAALAAASAGDRVILVERRPWLGGDAPFFGTVENESSPEDVIARLSTRLQDLPGVTILRRADAFRLGGGTLRVHQVELVDGAALGRVVDIQARRIVLATGALERLPVFSGNRLPRVTGAISAFHRAERFGVWLGQSALFSTQNNYVYRLALRAHDAGIAVQRVIDTRINPQSRFLDFSKAVGFTLASGLLPSAATMVDKGAHGVSVRFSVGFEGIDRAALPMPTEQFILSGGWQPDLHLWARAGGDCRWNPHVQRCEAAGMLEGVVLAGAAAGHFSTAACLKSGTSAGGRVPQKIEDRQIDAAFETFDGPTPLAPPEDTGSAFLDWGDTLARRQGAAQKSHFGQATAPAGPLGQATALSFGDIAACIQLGEIAGDGIGIVARERLAAPGIIADTGWPMPAEPDALPGMPPVPAYLAGRFGPNPILAIVATNESRLFEPGTLIYANAPNLEPRVAVGVVIAAAPDRPRGGLALLARTPAEKNDRLLIMDPSGLMPVRLIESRPPDVPR